MTFNGWIQIALFCAVIVLITKPFGGYMTRVFAGERTLLSPVLGRSSGSTGCAASTRRPSSTGSTYAVAMLLFSLAGFLSSTRCCACRHVLPFNPPASRRSQPTSPSTPRSASPPTPTGSPTAARRHELPHADGWASRVHNFVSAATGIALAVALIRGFARALGEQHRQLLGRSHALHALRPAADLRSSSALFLVWQGMPQNLDAYVEATTLEGAKQTIAQGPVASQEAIKMLGTNGGGFFNANSAHPFENPTRSPTSSRCCSIFSIGAALTNIFGRMVGDQRQGWAIFAVMGVLFLAGVHRRLLGGGRRQSRLRRSASGLDARRQHGRQGGPLRHRQLRPVRRRSPPTPRAARSTPCTTASCRSAAWCRWSTCSWARSSSAASAPASTACCCSPSSRCSSPA